MMTLPFFQVDAFAEAPLTGNPAAVMPLDHWLDDELMQRIAGENIGRRRATNYLACDLTSIRRSLVGRQAEDGERT